MADFLFFICAAVIFFTSVNSVPDGSTDGVIIDGSLNNDIRKDSVKPRIFYDYQTRIVAYKDLEESRCLLELLRSGENFIGQNYQKEHFDHVEKDFFMSENQLSKQQIWSLGGQRISDFCRGFPTFLIHDLSDNAERDNDLGSNELKRRHRRSTRHYFVGRVRGQTQSQYLNYGTSKDPGKAEAESTYEGSKAIVTGTSGMGQAQSQSSPLDCEGCYEQAPPIYDKNQILQVGRDQQRLPARGQIPGYQGQYRPSGPQLPSGIQFPDQFRPSQVPPGYVDQGGRGQEGYRPGFAQGPGRQTIDDTADVVSRLPGQRERPDQGNYPPISEDDGGQIDGEGERIDQGYPSKQRPSAQHVQTPGGSLRPGSTEGRPGYDVAGSRAPGEPALDIERQRPGGPKTPGYIKHTSRPVLRPSEQSLHYPDSQHPGYGVSQVRIPGYQQPTAGGEGIQSQTFPGQTPEQYPESIPGQIYQTGYGSGGPGYSGEPGRGRFNGQVAGEYSSRADNNGRFSGTFSGEYEAYQNGHRGQWIGATDQQGRPGHGFGQLDDRGRGHKPGVQTVDQYERPEQGLGQTAEPGRGRDSALGISDQFRRPGQVGEAGSTDQYGGPGVATHRGHVGFPQGPPGGYPGTAPPEDSGIGGEQLAPGQVSLPAYPGGGSGGSVVQGYGTATRPSGSRGQGQIPSRISYPILSGTRSPAGVGVGESIDSSGIGRHPGQHRPGESRAPGLSLQPGVDRDRVQYRPGSGETGGVSGVIRPPGYSRQPGEVQYRPGLGYPGEYVQPGGGETGFGDSGSQSGIGSGMGIGQHEQIGGPGYPGPVPGSGHGGEIDDADSQVQTSVHQTNNITEASAQAQGLYGGVTAQSQVSGSYSASGSFSASAGTDDGRRGALTQVSGGKEGAKSSAQGRGGAGQSQAEVQLSAETGDTISNAQTSGLNHGSQTKVQASGNGGSADAQSNGPGITSSQAQIGFTPYDENDTDNQQTPFKGGGTASAQSGSFSGQTQSQIQGKFNYGIRYTGAAQAGSDNRGGVLNIQNQTNVLTSNFKPILFEKLQLETINASRNSTTRTARKMAIVQSQSPQEEESTSLPVADEEDEYEYEDESVEKPETKSMISQISPNQKQHIILDPLEDLDAAVLQSYGYPEDGSILQPGEIVPGSPGYKIPIGFRGRVKSIATGSNAFTSGQHSQAQSVTLTPGTGRIIYKQPVHMVSSNTHLRNSRVGYGSQYTYYQPRNRFQLKSGETVPQFIAKTRSESGATNPRSGHKSTSVFYTQSSSCGSFTKNCVLDGSGRICTHKIRSDGTLISC